MQTQFRNYRMTNSKGERLTFVANKMGTNLQIFKATCLKGDTFSKKVGVEEALKNTPILIPIEGDNSAHWTFRQYCKQFYRKVEMIVPLGENDIVIGEFKNYKNSKMFNRNRTSLSFTYLTKY